MQIPLWAFLFSILIALAWKEMAYTLKHNVVASSLTSIKRVLPLSVSRNIPTFLQHHTPTRPFTQSQTIMSSQTFLDTVKARRSYYQLEAKSPIDDKKIQDIVEQALLQVPSSFNSQSTRIILLLKAEHEKFWEVRITRECKLANSILVHDVSLLKAWEEGIFNIFPRKFQKQTGNIKLSAPDLDPIAGIH